MKNQELIFREILHQAIEKKNKKLTQSELSEKLGISLSIINSAVKKLSLIGAVRINKRNFNVLDITKILYFWASIRNLNKDIIYKARIDIPVREIERIMPDLIFTGYSAFKFRFHDVPADYSEVYVYADDEQLEEIKKRLKKAKISKNRENLFVLKKDRVLKEYKNIPLSQVFVDLWNLGEWYSKEFVIALENKIKEI